jgi:hypothetical protein
MTDGALDVCLPPLRSVPFDLDDGGLVLAGLRQSDAEDAAGADVVGLPSQQPHQQFPHPEQ